ncbi:unnamed protein product [Staurois parvus]|uniref:Olfactory receptor n=1 Tax=Staurois parvus TaxID=386267 RepID=A0ABN9HH03_9NEOB|nr:unnamed protein product [Staurois parvus]
MGVPGMEDIQMWFSIPVFIMYVFIVSGNIAICYIILSEESLHKPMCLLLSTLSIADVLLATTTTPKILSIFWFHSREIGFSACLAQLFFVHAFSMMESTILLAMAFDRYVAICHPLRYTSILTNDTIAKIGIVAIIRGSAFMAPASFLIWRLSYCQNNIILHTYCEHMAVVKISCSDTSINQVYGLTVALLVIAVDIFVYHGVVLCHRRGRLQTVFQGSPWEGLGHLWPPCLRHPDLLHPGSLLLLHS